MTTKTASTTRYDVSVSLRFDTLDEALDAIKEMSINDDNVIAASLNTWEDYNATMPGKMESPNVSPR